MALTASDHLHGGPLLAELVSSISDVSNSSTMCDTCQETDNLMAACSVS